jgi:proteasome assembly chaperone 3
MGLSQNYGMSELNDTRVTIPFPVPTKQVAGEINGVKTDVMYMAFADKIMITITQNGKLGQWVGLLPISRL